MKAKQKRFCSVRCVENQRGEVGPIEILAGTMRIQREWSEEERRVRAGFSPEDPEWTPQEFTREEVRDAFRG